MAQTSNFLSPSDQKITFSDFNMSSEVLVKSDNLNAMNKMPMVVQPVALKTQCLLTIIVLESGPACFPTDCHIQSRFQGVDLDIPQSTQF